MKTIAIICARGGSKRVPRKNIKSLAGKPLIAYTIETALKCNIFDRIIVSTEDKEIAEVSKKTGAEIPFMRKKELAQDGISRWTVLRETVKRLEKEQNYIPEIVVDLSPTAPFRTPEDIKKCLYKLINEKADLVTLVYESERNPYFNMVELDDKGRARLVKSPNQRITQSQKAPKVYSLADSVNAVKRKSLLEAELLFDCKNIKTVLIPRRRALDIDNKFDFLIAECIMKNQEKFKHIL